MRSSTFLTISLLRGLVFAAVDPEIAAAPLELRGPTSLLKCNADNCLNVMTNTPAVASPFCSIYLQPTSVTTITPTITISGRVTISPTTSTSVTKVLPSHISQQCASATSTPLITRLSSACSCLSITPSSSTVTSTFYAAPTTTTIPLGTQLSCATTGVYTPFTYDGETFDLSCGPIWIYNYGGSEGPQGANLTSCLQQCADAAECTSINWQLYPEGPVCNLLNANSEPETYTDSNCLYGLKRSD